MGFSLFGGGSSSSKVSQAYNLTNANATAEVAAFGANSSHNNLDLSDRSLNDSNNTTLSNFNNTTNSNNDSRSYSFGDIVSAVGDFANNVSNIITGSNNHVTNSGSSYASYSPVEINKSSYVVGGNAGSLGGFDAGGGNGFASGGTSQAGSGSFKIPSWVWMVAAALAAIVIWKKFF